MTTKPPVPHLGLSPETHSWLIRKTADTHQHTDQYVVDLIEQARTRDLMGGKVVHHLDGDLRNLELSNVELRDSHEHAYDEDSDCIICGGSAWQAPSARLPGLDHMRGDGRNLEVRESGS